jgi:hypothetical protein
MIHLNIWTTEIIVAAGITLFVYGVKRDIEHMFGRNKRD